MMRDDRAAAVFARLADALAADLLGADEAEVLGSHAGQAGRVVADAVRQALRRGSQRSEDERGLPGGLVRLLTMRPIREDKP